MSLDFGYRDAGGAFKDVGLSNPLPVRALPPSLPGAKYVQLTFAGYGLAPHATTGRQSYTVPAGKAALLLEAWGYLYRNAAGTPGQCLWELGWNPSGSSTIYAADGVTPATAGVAILQCRLWAAEGLGAYRDQHLTTPLFFPAGTSLFVNTADFSTGGNVDYVMGAMVVEFTP